MKILVTPTSFSGGKDSGAKERLLNFADEVVYNETGAPLSEDALIPLLDGCDGMLAGLDYIGSKALRSAAGKLKAISRYGVGVDRVDIDTAHELGILVANTPGVNANAVADLAMGLILSVARQIPLLDTGLRKGIWARTTGIGLNGKTLGLIGFGAVGRQLALRAAGFGMRVVACDPFINEEQMQRYGVCSMELAGLLRISDVVSLHLPLNNDTFHIIDEDAFRSMKNGAILINTARGGLIHEQAAYEALKAGKLSGLGLDAFEKEPPDVDDPLMTLKNVVLTPHAGGHTREAIDNMANAAVDNLIRMLTGQECSGLIR